MIEVSTVQQNAINSIPQWIAWNMGLKADSWETKAQAKVAIRKVC